MIVCKEKKQISKKQSDLTKCIFLIFNKKWFPNELCIKKYSLSAVLAYQPHVS